MESPSVQGNDRVPHNTSIFFCIKSSAHKQKMKTIKNHPAVDHWCNLKAFLLNHPKLLTHFSSPFRYSIYPKKTLINFQELPSLDQNTGKNMDSSAATCWRVKPRFSPSPSSHIRATMKAVFGASFLPYKSSTCLVSRGRPLE